MTNQRAREIVWGLLRLALGWIFLWPFIDKLFGLGFSTPVGQGWLAGTSPTAGFLSFGTKGPFAEWFAAIAGHPVVDWLYMLGLLFAGLTLVLGIVVRLGSYAGIAMLLLIYVAGFLPPEHNPFLDEHLIYTLVLVGISLTRAGDYIGLGSWWRTTRIVKVAPWLL